jgi:hypothetical protein
MRLALGISVLVALGSPRADAGRGGSLIKYLRDDATYALVVDVEHARQTPLFGKAFAILHAKYAWWDELGRSGITIEKLVDTVVVGGATDPSDGKSHMVVVLDGKLDQLAAAAKQVSKKTEAYGGVTMWSVDTGELALIDKRLVLTSPGDMHALIDRVRGKTKPKGSARIRELLAAAPRGTDLFGGSMLDSSWSAQFASETGSDVTWAVISIAAATKMTIEVRFRLADEAAAGKAVPVVTNLVDPMRSQLEQYIGKDFADSISVDQDRSLLRISATLTADEVDKVVGILKMMPM